MNYGDLSIMQLMKRKMQYNSQRQNILGQNVANADTPGYKAQDLQAPDFKRNLAQAAQGIRMMRTDAMHMDGRANMKPDYKMQERVPTWETNPNENTVALEEELQKASLNQSEYLQVASLYRKTTEMFKTAIGRPQ